MKNLSVQEEEKGGVAVIRQMPGLARISNKGCGLLKLLHALRFQFRSRRLFKSGHGLRFTTTIRMEEKKG